MTYLGRPGATAPLTSADIPDNSITGAKIVAGTIEASDVAADMATQAELDTVSTVASAALPKAGGTMTGNIVMGDDTSIGISDSDERIEFDGAGDISVLGANLGVGTTSPAVNLDFGTPGDATLKQLIGLRTNGNSRIGIGTAGSGMSQSYYVPSDVTATEGFVWGTIASSDGATFAEKMRLTREGEVGIGRTPITDSLLSLAATSLFISDMATPAPGGNYTQTTSTSFISSVEASSGTHVYFISGHANAVVGTIASSGASVTYGSFTGVHYGQILESEITQGAVVTISKCTMPSNQPKYELKYSTTKNDSKVLGVVGSEDKLDYGDIHDSPDPEEYMIFALGDGGILVTDSEGNIDAGDYLASSERSGHAAKQDTNALMNYTIAKSLIDVDWSTIEADGDLGFKSKYIPCTYHCA